MVLVLAAGCSKEDSAAEPHGTQQEDMQSGNGKYVLDIDVVETDWEGETVFVTRAGETMEGLRTNGFGLYCSELSYENTQVTWDNTGGKWVIGGNDYKDYWPINSSGELNIYAYAPYKSPESPAYDVTNGKLTFDAELHSHPSYNTWLTGNNVDLLYANKVHSRNSDTPAELKFNHALAKLTFGTVTNNTGENLYLNGFTVRSKSPDKLYKQAVLDLATGKWNNQVEATSQTIQYPPPFVTFPVPPLADKNTIIPPMPNRELLVIPGADDTIDLTIEVNSSNTTEEFSFDVTLEKGKNKTYNITVQKNFEVVIE